MEKLTPKDIELPFTEIHPKYSYVIATVVYARALLILTVAICMILHFDFSTHYAHITLILSGVAMALLGLPYLLQCQRQGFLIRPSDMVIRKGWLVKRIYYVPIGSLSSVSFRNSYFTEKLGITNLALHTTGGEHFMLRGVEITQAKAITDYIISKRKEKRIEIYQPAGEKFGYHLSFN